MGESMLRSHHEQQQQTIASKCILVNSVNEVEDEDEAKLHLSNNTNKNEGEAAGADNATSIKGVFHREGWVRKAWRREFYLFERILREDSEWSELVDTGHLVRSRNWLRLGTIEEAGYRGYVDNHEDLTKSGEHVDVDHGLGNPDLFQDIFDDTYSEAAKNGREAKATSARPGIEETKKDSRVEFTDTGADLDAANQNCDTPKRNKGKGKAIDWDQYKNEEDEDKGEELEEFPAKRPIYRY